MSENPTAFTIPNATYSDLARRTNERLLEITEMFMVFVEVIDPGSTILVDRLKELIKEMRNE